MKSLLFAILFTVVAVALSQFFMPPSSAASFYVALNGNDATGYGSSSSPWRTIDHAITHVPDGSTILVRSGTYTGRVNLRGSFAQGVVVRSEVPYFAALRNNDRVVTIYEGQGITLEGFEGAACSTGVSPTFASFPASPSSGLPGIMGGDINVFTDDGCAWEARSNAGWIIIGNNAGIGRGTVTYGVEPNTTGQARKGAITVAGKTVSIKQRR